MGWTSQFSQFGTRQELCEPKQPSGPVTHRGFKVTVSGSPLDVVWWRNMWYTPKPEIGGVLSIEFWDYIYIYICTFFYMDHRAVCPHDMTFGMIVDFDQDRSPSCHGFWSSEWDVSWIQRNMAILRESNMAGWEIHVINEACHRKTTENGACSSHLFEYWREISQLIPGWPHASNIDEPGAPGSNMGSFKKDQPGEIRSFCYETCRTQMTPVSL